MKTTFDRLLLSLCVLLVCVISSSCGRPDEATSCLIYEGTPIFRTEEIQRTVMISAYPVPEYRIVNQTLKFFDHCEYSKEKP